jgi:hypothetical protein
MHCCSLFSVRCSFYPLYTVHMEWLRMHTYLAMLGGAAVLVVLGAFIVGTRTPAPPSTSQTVAWGGTGAILSPSQGLVQSQDPRTLVQQISGGVSLNTILPVPQRIADNATNTTAADNGFDFNAFISMLSSENQPTAVPQSDTTAPSNAYAFIPSGFVSVASASKPKTPQQQALYDYGNEVGSLIQSFEQENPNASQVLWDQAQDRTDAGKAAALTRLAQGLSALGDSIAAIEIVPAPVQTAHEALAQSYRALGTKLALVPQAQGDAAFIAAVNAYNAAAQTFVTNYVSMANLFVMQGVSFSQTDAGSLFSFTPTGSF